MLFRLRLRTFRRQGQAVEEQLDLQTTCLVPVLLRRVVQPDSAVTLPVLFAVLRGLPTCEVCLSVSQQCDQLRRYKKTLLLRRETGVQDRLKGRVVLLQCAVNT